MVEYFDFLMTLIQYCTHSNALGDFVDHLQSKTLKGEKERFPSNSCFMEK